MSGIWRYQSTSIPLRLANAGAVVALPLLAVEQLGDVAVGGFLVAVALFPSVIAAPLVGALLDRMRRPKLLLIIGGTITAAAYLFASQLGTLPIGVIAAILAVAGFVTPAYMGGLSSFATDNIEPARKAYAQDALSYTIASVGGPALAALAIPLAGSARLAMVLLASLAFVGAVAGFGIRMHAKNGPVEGLGRTIARGMTYLVKHKPIAIVTIAGTVSQVAGGALGIAAIAISLERTGSEASAAWLVTAYAIGGLAGALSMAVRTWTTRGPVWVMGMGFVATGVFLLIAVPALPIGFAFAAVLISGLFAAPANAAMMLLRDKESKPNVRSQVFTIGAGLRVTAAAVGAAIAGLIAGFDAGWLIAGMAIIWILSGAILWFFPNPPARTGIIPVQRGPQAP
ncbi:hypothetical protein C5E10_01245 [Pseudoclavibacter sp. RFBG4]|uniref:MFS transporter n=1 Tax=Pseudoclavibacter sp. RFBG4 TaxID=2080575 RepID=UPI000CE91678|nr:MFS transporter [Pseudoclavibacter sp. RFBG4]PPG36174.1 hypothetical protein C5E10_01245 [Pseudoclavibacter sp. RFBG4]